MARARFESACFTAANIHLGLGLEPREAAISQRQANPTGLAN